MAEETNAGRRAWNLIMGLAEEKSDGAKLRALLLLVLLGGAAFAGFTIYQNMIYLPPEIVPPEQLVPAADKQRLDGIIQNLNTANAARINSMEVAEANALLARYPFFNGAVQLDDGGVDTGVVERLIVPPSVRMKAYYLQEGKASAIIDIEGELSGRIYRAGDRFAGGKGRIRRIARDKVTIVFEGKEFVIGANGS